MQFIREDLPGIVSYSQPDFTITATVDGVNINSCITLTTEEDLFEIELVMSWCYAHFERLTHGEDPIPQDVLDHV
jgi:hypothetical protein